jgi:hypothetical protein
MVLKTPSAVTMWTAVAIQWLLLLVCSCQTGFVKRFGPGRPAGLLGGWLPEQMTGCVGQGVPSARRFSGKDFKCTRLD